MDIEYRTTNTCRERNEDCDSGFEQPPPTTTKRRITYHMRVTSTFSNSVRRNLDNDQAGAVAHNDPTIPLISRQIDLGTQRVPHTLAAGADRGVGGRQDTSPWLSVLLDLSNGVDDTANKANDDSRNAGEGNRGIEENKSRDSNGKLVQSSNHGVSGRRSDANAPGGGIGNKHRRQAGEDHGENDAVAVHGREVAVDVGG